MVLNGYQLINVRVETPTGKFHDVGVEGSLCRELIHVFDEIEDIPCQAWIYEKLNNKIVHSTPHYIGSYLGYKWHKAHLITPSSM